MHTEVALFTPDFLRHVFFLKLLFHLSLLPPKLPLDQQRLAKGMSRERGNRQPRHPEAVTAADCLSLGYL